MAQQESMQSSITENLVANIGASAYAQPGSGWGYPTQTTTDMNGTPLGDQMEIARNETVADNKPRLVILEQPKARGFRFRYDCEGQSHGGLPGENSERNRKAKSYPTVQLVNYRGRARIVVSLVTESDPPLPHAHSIVGRNTENGQCTVEVGPENDMCATFPNLGILHVTRKKVVDVLTERFIQNKAMQITMQGGDPNSQLGEAEREAARREADKVSKGMNLSVVRLCFQAYLPDEKGFFRHALEPVFGQKVYDSKAPSAANLKISRIDRPSGSVRGGDEVYLLCDKVQKNDIEVVFYEEGGIVKQEGDVKQWEALGSFGPQDVHHQYAVVFKTPPYYNMAIERPVTVMIALRRPSDKESSDPKPFTYLPQEFDEERIGQKRRKKLDHYTNFFRGGPGGPPGSGGPPPPGGDPGAGGMGDGGQGVGGQGAFFQGYYAGGAPTGPYAFATGYQQGQNPMEFQRQFNQGGGGGRVHGQPVSGDFQPGFDFSHQPGYDDGWGGGESVWGNPMGNPPSYDTHMGGYGYGTDVPYGGSHGSMGIRDRGQAPPRPPEGRKEGGGTKLDLEAEESGFGESNVPSLDQVTEQLHQQLMESRSELARRQRQAMEVCERLLRALMEWARTRDTRYLLAAQQDIIAVQNGEGDTALHVAIINNHTDVVRALLDVLPQLPPTQTPVVDTQNHLHQAPLHLAVLTKQTEVVDLLLKAQADKMSRDRNGNTPMHLAAQQGSVEMVQVLLSSPQQQHAMQGACTHPELSMLNVAGYTPMHLAVLCGNVQTMKLLHSAGADINATDSKSGRSPLHYASEKGELGLAGFLIVQRDIYVDQPDYHGNTALHLASGSGHVELVKLLIQGGAQINLMNNEREFPLDLARLKGHVKVIELLEQYLSQDQQREDEAITHQMGSVSIVDQQQSDPITPRPAAMDPLPTIKPEPSDLWMLSSMTRLKLAILLDPWREGQDWCALAERIGLGHLVPAFKAMSSPTKDLLSFYEDMSGTIDALIGHLQDMGRTDAVNLMQIAVKEYGGSESASANSGPMLGNPFMLNPGTASGPPSGLSLPVEERRQ